MITESQKLLNQVIATISRQAVSIMIAKERRIGDLMSPTFLCSSGKGRLLLRKVSIVMIAIVFPYDRSQAIAGNKT